ADRRVAGLAHRHRGAGLVHVLTDRGRAGWSEIGGTQEVAPRRMCAGVRLGQGEAGPARVEGRGRLRDGLADALHGSGRRLGARGLTVAVKVTSWPRNEGLSDEVTATLLPLRTDCVREPEVLAKLVPPL